MHVVQYSVWLQYGTAVLLLLPIIGEKITALHCCTEYAGDCTVQYSTVQYSTVVYCCGYVRGVGQYLEQGAELLLRLGVQGVVEQGVERHRRLEGGGRAAPCPGGWVSPLPPALRLAVAEPGPRSLAQGLVVAEGGGEGGPTRSPPPPSASASAVPGKSVVKYSTGVE